MPAKKTKQDLEEACLNLGLTILSPDYINNATKLSFQCQCGNIFSTKPMIIFRGSGCRRCAVHKRKATFQARHGVSGAAEYRRLITNAKPSQIVSEPPVDTLFGIPFVTDGILKTVKLREDFSVVVADLANTPPDWRYMFKFRKAEEAAGRRVMFFFSREWEDKRQICEQIIKTNLGLHTERIAARKCEIVEVRAREFFDKYHLMGDLKSSKHVCLVLDGEIVCAMSYRKKDDGIDISRFACKESTIVQGGFTKLLKWVEEKYNPVFVLNWVDARYGTGKHLLNKGFECPSANEGFWWTDKNGILINRLKCRANIDERRLTEKQQAEEWGWWRVYDAGQIKYIKYRTITSPLLK